MKQIYKFHWNCGRGGEVEGVFIADDATVTKAIGSEVYFGEILGKHSEVYGVLEEKDLKVLSADQDFIARCEEVFEVSKPEKLWGNPGGNLSGYNPFDYIRETCEVCENEMTECECECEKCRMEKWECECDEE